MSDWREAVDPGTGRTYYANIRTKVTQWAMPEDLRRLKMAQRGEEDAPPPPPPPPQTPAKPAAPAPAAPSTPIPPTPPHQPPAPPAPQPPAPQPPAPQPPAPPAQPPAPPAPAEPSAADWREGKDAQGRVYYYNKKTGQSTWIRPTVLGPAAPSAAALEKLQQDKTDLSARVTKLQAQIERLEAQLDKEKHKNKQQEAEFASLTEEKNKLAEKQAKADAEAGGVAAQLSAKEAELAEVSKNLKLAELEAVKLKDDLAKEKQNGKKADEALKKAKADLEASENRFRDMELRMSKMRHEFNNELGAKDEALRRALDENKALQTQLQQAKEHAAAAPAAAAAAPAPAPAAAESAAPAPAPAAEAASPVADKPKPGPGRISGGLADKIKSLNFGGPAGALSPRGEAPAAAVPAAIPEAGPAADAASPAPAANAGFAAARAQLAARMASGGGGAEAAKDPAASPVSATKSLQRASTIANLSPPTATRELSAPPPLPAGWVEYVDPNTKKPFYYNNDTKVTQWERPLPPAEPEGLPSPAPAPAVQPSPKGEPEPGSTIGEPAETSGPNPTPAPAETKPEPAAEAKPAEPAETKPEKPVDEAKSVEVAGPPAGPPPNDAMLQWQEVLDKSSGNVYYYNKVTRTTQWVKPAGWDDAPPPPPPAAAGAGAAPFIRSSSLPAINANLAQSSRVSDAVMSPLPPPLSPRSSTAGAPLNRTYSSVGLPELNLGRSLQSSSFAQSLVGGMGLTINESDEKAAVIVHTNQDEALAALPLDQLQKFSFAQFADKFFNAQKKGVFGQQSIEDRITHTSKALKVPLTKVSQPHEDDALQTFRNITSYMGERSSSKAPAGHIKKLCKMALTADDELRDEIYCQLMKQCNNNPDRSFNIRGWKLFSVLLGVFPPSKKLQLYLKAYLQAARDHKGDAEVPPYANYCEEQLFRTYSNGPRETVPLQLEIDAVENRGSIPLPVYFPDGSNRILALSSQSTVLDVTAALVRFLDLPHRPAALLDEWMWGLYEFDPEQCTLRSLPFQKRVMDVRAQWIEKVCDRRGMKSSDAAISPDMELKLLFKPRLYFSREIQLPKLSPSALHLFYSQGVSDVVEGNYVSSNKDAITLAALQIQAEFEGAEVQYADLFSESSVKNYFSKTLAQQYKGNETHLRQLVANERNEKYKALSRPQAKTKYLELLQSFPVYGCQFFAAEEIISRGVDECLLGVSEKGVFTLHPFTRQTTKKPVPMNEIQVFYSKEDMFEFEAGGKKLTFKTRYASVIERLVRTYHTEVTKNAA